MVQRRSMSALISSAPVYVTDQDEDKTSSLFIVHKSSRIQIGADPLDVLSGGYKKPERALSITSIPPGFEDSFRVYGWDSATRSVGLISRNRKVLLAVDTQKKVDATLLDTTLLNARRTFGEPVAQNQADRSNYWFWQENGIRLMICRYVNDSGSVTMTTAIGLNQIMDHFRMSADSATKDAFAASEAHALRAKS